MIRARFIALAMLGVMIAAPSAYAASPSGGSPTPPPAVVPPTNTTQPVDPAAPTFTQNPDGSYTVTPGATTDNIDQTIDQEAQQTSQAITQQGETQAATDLSNLNSTGSVTGNSANAINPSENAAVQSALNGNGAGGGTNADPSAAFGYLLGGLMTLFAWLAGAAGILLNDAVYYTVLQMGNYVNNLSAVGVSWRILRDIGNIVLIFGFVAIGISTIVGYDSYGVSKRLPTLLIVAVLLNFSLFISEAIIDTGNIFAAQFYTEINGGQQATYQSIGNYGSNGISNSIMNSLGLATLYNINGVASQSGSLVPTNTNGSWNTTAMLVGFLGVILFITAAFVMFSLAFILVARFVALVFLIIVAPVGFAGLIIPKLEGTAQEWWHQLFNQALTAPVLILMLYIALAVITDSKFLTGLNVATTSGGSIAAGGGYATLLGSQGPSAVQDLAGLLLSFVVAMGLLLMCTFLAKRMSAFGASAATSLASKLSGASLATALPGWAMRSTVGAGAHRLGEYTKGTALGRTFVGRGLVTGLGTVGKASFDLKNTDAAKQLSKATGFNLGEGQKGGYKQDLKNKADYYEDAFSRIKGRKKTAEEIAAETAAQERVDTTREGLAGAGIRRADAEAAVKLDREKEEAAQTDLDAKKADLEAKQADREAKRKELDDAKSAQETSQVAGGPADPAVNLRRNQAEQNFADADQKAAAAEQEAAKSEEEVANAGKAVSISQKRLKEIQEEFQKSNARVAEATKAQIAINAKIKEATSDKAAQKEYAEKIKKVAGVIPRTWVFGEYGTSVAADRILKNAGKSKDVVEIEKLLKKVTDNTDKTAKAEAKRAEEEGGH